MSDSLKEKAEAAAYVMERERQIAKSQSRNYVAEALAMGLNIIAELAEAVPEWMPMESAPKDGTPILLLAPGCRDYAEGSFRYAALSQVIGHWESDYDHGKWCGDLVKFESGWEGTGSYTVVIPLAVIGWQPLPAPPTDGENK